jgi:DNA-binding transcriptional MerR regulator
MAQLPEEFHLPLDFEPAGVFIFGKPPELRASDLASGLARIGGFRTPDYGKSYLLAANTLLRTAQEERTLDHHGLPIFYLQRHAAELMIKAALQLGMDIQQYREELNLPRPKFPSKKQEERAQRGHGLHELLTDLEAMASELQAGIVPEVLRSVIKEILKVEQSQPTWSRYSFRLEVVQGSKTRHTHLPSEVTIPLATIQNQLQTAVHAIGFSWIFDGRLMGMLGSQLDSLWRQAGDID